MTDTDTKVEDGEGTVDDKKQDDEGVDLQAEVEKWKALSRKHETQAKQNAAAAKRVAEMEDATKSDIERATAAATAAENRAEAAEAKALKYEVAAAKGIAPNLMKFLTGSTEEELETAADELLAAVRGDKPDGDGDGKTGGLPKEALRSGAAGSDDDEPEKELADVLAAIPRP